MLEMMSDALTNMGKQITLKVTCAQSQRYKSVCWLAQMMLCLMTWHNFPPFVRPNHISDGPIMGCWYIRFWVPASSSSFPVCRTRWCWTVAHYNNWRYSVTRRMDAHMVPCIPWWTTLSPSPVPGSCRTGSQNHPRLTGTTLNACKI